MDVTLPNGQVLTGVPEGTTKAQIAAKVPAEWLVSPEQAASAKTFSGISFDSHGQPIPVGQTQSVQDALDSAAQPKVSDAEAKDAAATALARRFQASGSLTPTRANDVVQNPTDLTDVAVAHANYIAEKPNIEQATGNWQPPASPEEHQALIQQGLQNRYDSQNTAEHLATQAGQGALDSLTLGLAPQFNVAPQTASEEVSKAAGNLAGFIAGPGIATGKGFVGLMGGLEHTYGESFVKALAKDVVAQSATLGIATGLTATGDALRADNVQDARQIIANAAASGAGMGAIFGAFARVLPDQTVSQIAARVLGVNAAMDLANGQNPMDRRSLGQKFFDYGLNTVFALRGAGRVEGGWVKDVNATKADQANTIDAIMTPENDSVDKAIVAAQADLNKNRVADQLQAIRPEVQNGPSDVLAPAQILPGGVQGRDVNGAGADLTGIRDAGQILPGLAAAGDVRAIGAGVQRDNESASVVGDGNAELRATPVLADSAQPGLPAAEAVAELTPPSERRTDAATRRKVADMTPEERANALLIDDLTGLKNNRAYQEADKLPYQASIDVDGLKAVNDNGGHEAGNILLQRVGQALASVSHNAFHISGDEFVMQAHSPEELHTALLKAQEALKSVSVDAKTDQNHLVVKGLGFSFGVGTDLKQAEANMYLDKAERERTGLRAPRGELPVGAVLYRTNRRTGQAELNFSNRRTHNQAGFLGEATPADIAEYYGTKLADKPVPSALPKGTDGFKEAIEKLPEGGKNAVQEQEAGKILQREQAQTGEAGGERRRVEQGQQRAEAAGEGNRPASIPDEKTHLTKEQNDLLDAEVAALKNGSSIRAELEKRKRGLSKDEAIASMPKGLQKAATQMAERAEKNKRGGLVFGTEEENRRRAAQTLADKNGTTPEHELARLNDSLENSVNAYNKAKNQYEVHTGHGVEHLTGEPGKVGYNRAITEALKKWHDVFRVVPANPYDISGTEGVRISPSKNGKLSGFYHPDIGHTYVNTDNVAPADIPAVVMHEVRHMAQNPKLDAEVMRRLKVVLLNDNEKQLALFQRKADAGGYKNVDDWAAENPEEFKKTAEQFRAAHPMASRQDQIETPAFKHWFGESQIKDASGKPEVMYHGTTEDISEFSPKQAGAVFVTKNPEFAQDFVSGQKGIPRAGQNIVPVFVRAERPFDPDKASDIAALRKAVGDTFEKYHDHEFSDSIADVAAGRWMALENPVVQKFIKANYDGFYVYEQGEKNLAVYDPKQIKSAIGNAGEFSPNNSDIRKSVAPPFYSQLRRQMETVPDKILTNGKMAAGWLEANSAKLGIKKDELYWTGITDWLKTQGKVSKADVLAFLDGNGVQVTDVTLGEQQFSPAEEARYLELNGMNNRGELSGKSKKALWEEYSALRAKKDSGATKFASYQLPGGPLARDTEILTHAGWKRIDAVEVGEAVLTRRDEDSVLEWAEVEAKPEVYAEKLYHFANQSINMRVTACHKMVVKRRRRSQQGIFRVTAQELWSMAECVVPLTGKWHGDAAETIYDLPAKDIAELIGWYIAEGSPTISPTGHKSTLAIAQSREANSDKCTRIEALIDRLGFKWNYSGGQYYLSIKSMPRGLVEMLHSQRKSGEKYVPGFMFNFSSEILQSLLDGLLLGDGCIVKQEKRKPRWTYFTKSRQLADDVQVLALLTGKRGTVKQRPNGLYTVGINSKEWAGIDDAKHAIVDYNDTAYCVTVKNHAIYVRSNGVAAFTGNSNYKELLLTRPVNEKQINGLTVDGVSKALGYGGWHSDLTPEQIAHVNRVFDAQKDHPNTGNERRPDTFKSSHFDQPNILAHIRFNERTDAEGKRVLFLEEIQSDWGQKVKKEGFDTKPPEPLTAAEKDELRNVLDRAGMDLSELTPAQHERRAALIERSNQQYASLRKGVPSAPFVTDTKAWTALAMKRMIRYAAENGFDKVAWTTGEQQAARYDLSKQISSITYRKNTNRLTAYDLHDNKAFEEIVQPENLADFIGKDAAEKLVSAKVDSFGEQELHGVDLKVGGEGMKGYYDGIVPQVAKDILKKLGGGKVEGVAIEIPGGIGRWEYKGPDASIHDILEVAGDKNTTASIERQLKAVAGLMQTGMPLKEAMEKEGSYTAAGAIGGKLIERSEYPTQPGFTITPELRAKVLNEGLPLFSKQAPASGDIYARVRARMAAAGEEHNEREATPYLVEEALKMGQQAGHSRLDQGFWGWAQKALPQSVVRVLKEWVANIRAAMFRNGIALKEQDLSIDDFAAITRADMKDLASGRMKTEGEEILRAPSALGAMALRSEEAKKQTETPAFKKWAKNTPIIPLGKTTSFADGKSVVVEALHGTASDFTEFDKEHANVDSDLGAGFYFTNSKEDVSENYAGEGPDLTQRIQLRAEQIASATDRDYSDPEVVKEAREQLAVEHGGMAMPVYLRFDKPAVLGGKKETVLDWEERYDEKADTYEEPTGKLVDFIEALHQVAPDFSDADAEKFAGTLVEKAVDNGGIELSRVYDLAKARDSGILDASDSETGDLASGELLRRTLENMGYDGIIDQTVNAKFGAARIIGKQMKGVDKTTIHFVAFEPTQIKSALGNTGAFNPKAKSILASREPTSRLIMREEKQPEEDKKSRIVNAAKEGIAAVKNGFAELREAYMRPPVFTESKKIIGEYTGRLQEIDYTLSKLAKKINLMMPRDRQEAVTNYIQAGGDEALLRQRAKDSVPDYRKGYEDALTLTPEEKKTAKLITDYQDSFWKEANDAGILEGYVENYVRGQWERERVSGKGLLQGKSQTVKEQQTQRIMSLVNSGMLNDHPREAMQKVFASYFEGEKFGAIPTDKRIGFQFIAAQRSIQRAIAARKALTDLMSSKEADGRPTVAVGGTGFVTKEGEADKPYFIQANTKNSETADYRSIDHPAMRGWKYVGEDADGKPILMRGTMWIHPDAYGDLFALLGKSAIRAYQIPEKVPVIGGARPGDAMLRAGAFIKSTMLIGPFHQFHLAEHALFHKVNPFSPPEIDFDKRPLLREGVNRGLMLYNHNALQQFSEGLSSGGLLHMVENKLSPAIAKIPYLRHAPIIGDGLRTYQEWLFTDYIPRLKALMFEHAVARAEVYFKKDIASGKLTRDQLIDNAAKQANAAFGEQNYKYMGRNPTLQEGLQLGFLAPDFLESRFKFAGQALRPYGREQAMALFRGAAVMGISAQIVNLMLGDDKQTHWDRPFSVIIGGREYSPRSVVGDIAHLVEDPRGFWFHRINPLWGRPVYELATGRDIMGQKESLEDAAKNIFKSWTPIPAQGAFKNTVGQTLLQNIRNTVLQSVGVTNFPAKTPAEKLISDINFGHMRIAEKTPGEKKRYQDFASLRDAYLDGKLNSMDDVVAEAKKNHIILSRSQGEAIAKSRTENPVAVMQRRMRSFSAEEAMQVWDKMSDAEKETMRGFILDKLDKSKTMEPEDKAAAIKALASWVKPAALNYNQKVKEMLSAH